MNVSLEEALRSVDLEAGKTYSCQVNGLPVRVEVGTALVAGEPIDVEADTMLDPWTDLPRPAPVRTVRARVVAAELPEPPSIPTDEDDA